MLTPLKDIFHKYILYMFKLPPTLSEFFLFVSFLHHTLFDLLVFVAFGFSVGDFGVYIGENFGYLGLFLFFSEVEKS